MLNKFSLKNFKPFGEKGGELKLAPITLIYGPNSGGKSSVIQALMLLKQSFEGKPGQRGHLLPNGDYVNLGNFISLVHQHDKKREVELELEFSGPQPPWLANRVVAFPEDWRRFVRISYQLPSGEDGRLLTGVVDKVRYLVQDRRTAQGAPDIEAAKALLDCGFVAKRLEDIPKKYAPRAPEGSRLFRLQDPVEGSGSLAGFMEHLSTLRHRSRGSPQAAPNRSKLEKCLEFVSFEAGALGLPGSLLVPPPGSLGGDKKTIQEQLYRHLFTHRDLFEIPAILGRELLEILEKASYLGPLRSYPERSYDISGRFFGTVGKEGENTAQILFREGKKVQQQVNRWFEKLDIPYELKVRSSHSEEPIFGNSVTLELTDQRSGVPCVPSDVGFGIGQLLPIVVEGLASENPLILVEQPEIHLHPRLQARMGDFFIESSSEKFRGVRKQWIIETHSETLMLRLLRRIREGKLDPEDVAVNYVHQVEGVTTIGQLEKNSRGDFSDDWPDGFFEDSYEEIFGEDG